MGMYLFSHNSNDDCSTKKNKTEEVYSSSASVVDFGLPRADNYKINRYEEIGTKRSGTWLILDIKYPDSKNYEGNKILVYRDVRLTELKEQGSIDPHFSDPFKEYLSPIARFEPTVDGWHMAHVMIQSIILGG